MSIIQYTNIIIQIERSRYEESKSYFRSCCTRVATKE